MNKTFKLLVTAFFLSGCFSCTKINGEGPVVSENRTTGNFSAITSSIPGDIYYTQAPDYHVKIFAQQNILNALETYTSGHELIIKERNNVIFGRRERIKIEISSPQISGFAMSGSGSIISNESITSDVLSLTVSGSGNISLQSLFAKNLAAKISGSGDIKVAGGQLEKEDLFVSGSGEINTIDVPSKAVITKTSGSGTMRVHALETLDATISGSGSVYYVGDPVVNSKVSGSGRVKKQ